MIYYLTENQTEQGELSGYPYPHIARSGSIYIRTRFRDYPNHIWLPLYEDMQKDADSFKCGAMWATAYGNMTYEFWNGHACWHKTGSGDGYIRLASSLFVWAYNNGNWTLAMRGDGGGRAAFVMCSTNSYSSARNMACSPSRFAQADSVKWQDSSLDGTMHHTVYRCADYRLSVFIDGVKVYETTVETPNMNTVPANHGIYVGMLPSGWSYNGTTQGEWYTGGLSDVMGVPFALSDEQVLRLAGRSSCIEPKRGDPVLICGSGEDVILLPVRKTDDFEISTRVENRVGISGQGYDVYQGTPFWYTPNVFCSPVYDLRIGGESTFLDLASRLGMLGNPVFTEHQGMRCLYLNGSSHIRKYWPSSEPDTEYFYGGYRKAIMLWVNALYGGSGYLVSFGTSSRHFALSINESGIVTGECSSASVTSDISCAGDWHLLCLRYDGLTDSDSAGTNELALYIDGVKVSSQTASVDTEFNANWCVGSAAWSDGNYRPKAYVAQVHYLTARDTTEWKDLESDMQAAVRAVRSLKAVRLAYDLQVAIIGNVFIPIRNPFLREMFYRQALQRGLVFHAPLTDSLTYTTTGHTLSLSNSSRLTEGTVIDGMKCAQLSSGNDTYTGYLYADNVKGLPKGREPGTYCLWIFFGCEPGEQNTGWIGFLFAPLGGSSSGTIRCLGYNGENGHPRIGFYNYDEESTQTIYKRWVHFTMVYDGTNALIYINGELDSQFDKSVLNTGDYGSIVIGNRDGDSVRAQTAVTDVRVYNRVLSAEEIRAIYNLRKPVERPEGLLFWQHPEYVRYSVAYSGQPMRYAGTWLSSSYNGVSYSEFNGSSMQYTKAKAEYSLHGIQDQLSFGAWIYVNALTGSDQCVLGDAEAGGFCLYATGSSSDSTVGIRALVFAEGQSDYLTLTANTGVQTRQWVHIAVVYNGEICAVYVNGSILAQQALSGNITYGINNTSFGIGANVSGNTGGWIESFNGRVADVRVYASALTEAQLKDWYMFAPFFQPGPDLERDLVFYMPMEYRESTAQTGQTLSYYSSSSPVESTYMGMKGLLWNKTGYQYIEATLSALNSFSVCWWQVPDSTQSDKSIWSLYNGGGYLWCLQGVSLYNGSQHLHFSEGGAPDDELHFCCIVYDGAVYMLYVDGVSHGTLSQDRRFSTTQNVTLRIGNRSNSSGQYYYGWASHFRVYNRVLSEEEIQMLAGELTPVLPPIPEDSLVMYLPLRNGTAAATGQTTATTGDISFTEQQGIACMRLDGNSYLSISPSGSEFQFSTNTQWTISFKVCFDRTSGSDLEGLLCSAEPNTNGTFFIYHYLNGWSSSVSNSLGVGVNGSNEYTTSSGIFTAGVWNTVTIVRNGSSLKIVVNGAQYTGGSSSNVTNASKLYIPGGSPKLQGYMTAFRLYSRALTDDEIRALENEFTAT